MIKSPLSQLEETPITPGRKPSFKRRLRRIERVSLRHAHRYIIQRLANLREGRRRALSWLLLIAGLVGIILWQQQVVAQHYTAEVPAEGGIYTEGVFGAMDNLNPILASSPAERSGARLLFAQLLTYDNKGDLVGELAQNWQAENEGRAYTLTLRAGAKWQDGARITADDVVFTFGLIKNADTRSPLYSSWRNIAVEKVSDTTVRFLLPAPYAAFTNSLTVGILPRHILKDVRPSELRTSPYNRAPSVTSGPFVFQDLRALDTKQTHHLLRLAANKTYALGKPKLSGFYIHAYKDREDLVRAFRSQEIASFSDVTSDQLKSLSDSTPHKLVNSPLYNGVFAFLKTNSPLLSDVGVRRALELATDQSQVIKRLDGRVQGLQGPLLPGQLGYRPELRQAGFDPGQAATLLDQAGWVKGQDGKRRKGDQVLRLHLVSVGSGDYPAVAEELMSQWRKIGVDFEPQLVKSEDIQQGVIFPRGYDILLYEVAIGRDPDVYAYWHSSQATERGLNLSNYKSAKVDDALDSARTRLDPGLRDPKYRLFVQQWLSDVPAIALYRPTLTYIQNKNVVSFEEHSLVDPIDRYFNIRYWAAGRELQRPTR